MLTVAKFGGSSLSNEIQFAKVKNIVKSDASRRLVIVSAIGKKNPADDKVTDLLYLIAAHIKHRVSYQSLWENFTARFLQVKNELNLEYEIQADLDIIQAKLKSGNFTEDYLVSRGEYLTAKLMSAYLDYQFIDAQDVIIFASNGQIDLVESERLLRAKTNELENYVLPGFYGAYANGSLHLMSRGGSDITGAVVASCLKADKYENWTDVSGVLKADPKMIDSPVTTDELTYEELSELSIMGASVLHEESIYPIRSLNIPIQIKNTNAPEAKGTLIIQKHEKQPTEIAGISGKKDFLAINLMKGQMANEIGFILRTTKVFEEFSISIDHVPSGINQVSVILEKKGLGHKLLPLLDRLREVLQPDEMTVKEDISLLSIVGEGLVANPLLVGKVFTALGEKNIPIEMIGQSPLSINLIVGVENSNYKDALNAIYDAIVRK